MKLPSRHVLVASVIAAALATAGLVFSAGGAGAAAYPLLRSAHNRLANGRALPHISGGTEVAFDEERAGAADLTTGTADNPPGGSASALGCANRGSSTNPRANQDCTQRRQAEEQIAVNPLDPNNVIVGQNDSRVGFNHCGFDYSLDRARTWGDDQPGFFQHLSPVGHTYDAASDPNVTFTGTGRAWYSCVVFDINSPASGLFAVPSTPALKGAAYANIGAGASPYVVAETADNHTFYDKQFMAADPRPGHEEAYITFTVFVSDSRCASSGGYCSSEIWYSKWNGTAWSAPANLSGTSATLCSNGNIYDKKADPHACNLDQGSMPVVDPVTGDVIVVWNNGNTPAGDPNAQTLSRVIHADGTLGPVQKVGDDIVTGDALCDLGRGPEECVASLGVRTNDFPAIAIDPTNHNHLVAVWQDTRAVPNSAVGLYDVVVAESTNAGLSWTETNTLKGSTGQAYFEPSVAVTKTGTVAVSFYRANAYSGTDYMGTYGYGMRTRAPGGAFSGYRALSDGQSYPSPQANPVQAGFLGDYSSIAASTASGSNLVHAAWADTRNLASGLGPDEDVFVATVTP